MDTPPPAPAPDPIPAPVASTTVVSTEDKTVAIVSYLTLIGFIVAVVLHGNKKTKLGAFHLRQALGLMITGIASWVAAMILAVIPFVGWIVGIFLIPVLMLGLLALAIIGLVNAANGQMKPLPLLGDNFQKWFGSAFE